ncbi:MAG: TetR/AcrR family transcriptional regulator [Actinomycetota bacterium]
MPKIVDRDQKRVELLDAAVDAIAERGLDGVKLADIAACAGVTTGAIGHYFRDKNDVLVAALEHLSAQLRSDGGSAMTYFHGDLGLFLPTSDAARRLWRVWLAYCGVAPSSPDLLDAYRRFYSAIEGDIADHLRARGVGDADQLAGTIVAAVDGIGLCATVAPDLWPDERQIETIRTLLDSLAVPTHSTDSAPSGSTSSDATASDHTPSELTGAPS